jgi:hypothetical protein
MELGRVEKRVEEEEQNEEYYGPEGGQHETINGVGEVRYNCGGKGHYARDCPKKGKGKGTGKGKVTIGMIHHNASLLVGKQEEHLTDEEKVHSTPDENEDNSLAADSQHHRIREK